MSRTTSVAVMLFVAALISYAEPRHIPGWYGAAVGALLVAKLAASLFSKPYQPDTSGQKRVDALKVDVVITCFNEDVAMVITCLQSLLNQTRLPRSVTFVDDCSTDRSAVLMAQTFEGQFAEAGVRFDVLELPTNQGKRHALAAGFRLHPDADVYLCVDSDTKLADQAVAEGLKPFASRTTTAVTGLVLALNARRNILTRLIDLRYANAFLYERAAYSMLGSVLCCCGSLAFYKGTVVRENLEDFLTQTFLGVEATYGDDRRMTNYCLKSGKVVLQSSAVAWTLVPERMGHFLKQQTRWSKSFFRESLWVVQQGRMSQPSFWLSLTELTSWIVFTSALLATLVLAPFHMPLVVWPVYLMYAMVLGYARSVRYLEAGHTRMSTGERVSTFLLAPLYGILHVGLLLWVRVYALLTLRDNGWGTRAKVEVGI